MAVPAFRMKFGPRTRAFSFDHEEQRQSEPVYCKIDKFPFNRERFKRNQFVEQ
jgi:hypothetical protein